MTKRLVVLNSLFAAILYVAFPAHAALYVFGDSLSDAGNVWDASKNTAGLLPDPVVPPYYQGRMSNGRNWADHVADDLGLGPLSASRVGGTNYAWAGATTGTGTTNRKSLLIPNQTQPVDNVGKQIATFTIDHGGFAPGDLVAYWSGANDILYYALGGVPVATAVAHLANLTKDNLLALESLGAMRILLPNQIDAAKSPIWNGLFGLPAALQPYVSAVTVGFNTALAALAASLEAQAGFDADILLVDMYATAEAVIADPASYGLTDVTSPAFLSGANPDTALFWDPIHPTTAGHRLIADAAVAALVPEPQSALIFATALLLMAFRFHRQARRG